MGRRAVIVFAKEPVAGRVKTRLCPPLSQEQAARLYQCFIRDVLNSVLRVPRCNVEIAWDGSGPPEIPWLQGETPFFQQEGTDLGARLTHAFSRAFSAGARHVVAVGTDSPGLTPEDIERAFSALEDGKDLALGPAEDGGYYLIGLRRPAPELFERISWSTDRVLKETIHHAKRAGLSVELLPPFFDVDNFEDLLKLSGNLSKNRKHYFSWTQKVLEELEVGH